MADLQTNMKGQKIIESLNNGLEVPQLKKDLTELSLKIGLGDVEVTEELVLGGYVDGLQYKTDKFQAVSTMSIAYYTIEHDGLIDAVQTSTASSNYGHIGIVGSVSDIKEGNNFNSVVSSFTSSNSPRTSSFEVHAGDVVVISMYKPRMTASLTLTYVKTSEEPVVLNKMKAAISSNSNDISQLKKGLLSDKTFVVFGDSSTDNGITKWARRVATSLGCTSFFNEAVSGNTWVNRYTSGVLDECVGKQINTFLARGVTPDVIMFQLGGNDNSEDKGSVETAFATYDSSLLVDATTSAECMRYYLEKMRRLFPNALILVGSVFERVGASAQGINDIIYETCKKLCIQVVDGFRYLGFSPYTEAGSPKYCDAASPSREFPYYNYIEDETGHVVDQATATSGGVLIPGYSKRYGLYTYDGKHQSQAGEDKVYKFMLSELKKHLA